MTIILVVIQHANFVRFMYTFILVHACSGFVCLTGIGNLFVYMNAYFLCILTVTPLLKIGGGDVLLLIITGSRCDSA